MGRARGSGNISGRRGFGDMKETREGHQGVASLSVFPGVARRFNIEGNEFWARRPEEQAMN